MKRFLVGAAALGAASVCALGVRAHEAPGFGDGQRLLTIDHYVRVQSNVPAIAGVTEPRTA